MKILAFCALLALPASSALAASAYYPPPPVQTWPGYLPADSSQNDRFDRVAEALIAQRIDSVRAQYLGIPLAADPALTDIAQHRSAEMAFGAPFAHEDQQGRFIAADQVHERISRYGYVGENIMAMGSSVDFAAADFAARAVNGWMNSPGHRANILNANFRESGIGVAVRDGRAYATQVFYGPPPGRTASSRP